MILDRDLALGGPSDWSVAADVLVRQEPDEEEEEEGDGKEDDDDENEEEDNGYSE